MAALQFCAGKALRDEFSKEQKLIKILGDIGEKVKTASDPQRQVCWDINLRVMKFCFLFHYDSIKFECHNTESTFLDCHLVIRHFNQFF